MANSYKKVGNKNVATLKENASNASKVAEQAYSNSVAKVNAITSNARQKAINNYNASAVNHALKFLRTCIMIDLPS